MELGGWAVHPHIAISLKNIGLGFSLGRGLKESIYKRRILVQGQNYNSDQESSIAFTEIGLFLYWIPFPKLHKNIKATVILGGKSINAKHDYTEEVFSDSVVAGNTNVKTKRYNLSGLQAGLNIKYQVFKRFAITPWLDYQALDTNSIESEAQSDDGTVTDPQLLADIEFFWHTEPKTTYGVDFTTKIGNFEISFGGLLGAILTAGNSKASISDDAISVSISVNQKGR
ncbi:MAG: hypothetical protein HRU19_15810 [Pseudobacteriovorax sp.]|nr:hypothetical protein [Pseudobacteriovorax sp.]